MLDERHFVSISGSNFQDVLTKGKGEEWGKTALKYALELIAQHMTGWKEEIRAPALDFGNLHEPDAILAYELRTFKKVSKADWICLKDVDGNDLDFPGIGGTPDGFVGKEGMIEVKCRFNPTIHLNTILSRAVPDENKAQIQGYLWLTKRAWCDYVSYCPYFEGEKQLVVIRVYPDIDYLNVLSNRIFDFRRYVKDLYAKILEG
jgi:hypothetical protein